MKSIMKLIFKKPKNNISLVSFFSIVFLLSASCGKKSDMLYYTNPPAPGVYEKTQKIKELTGIDQLDILWIIGGMTEQQANFRQGMTVFMNDFTKKTSLDWHMGVISTDPRYQPFLGMDATPFDKNTANFTNVFVNSVMDVLRSYDGEQIFDPVIKALTEHPKFMRPNAVLAIVMTNDAHDYSRTYLKSKAFLDAVQKLKGDLNRVIIYGIIGSTDLNCQQSDIDENWNYKGSVLDEVVQFTKGQTYSLCDVDFGTSLAKIGDNLLSRVDHPKIFLSKRPRLETLRVLYHQQPLPGGTKEDGGFWTYRFDLNAVVFHDLSFAVGEDEQVSVTYEEDTGY